MSGSQSNDIERTLQSLSVHQKWENSFRTADNEEFYEQAFDYITSVLNAPKNSKFLDAGCGTCAHSIRLAKRGYSILAIDFSESILKKAQQHLQSTNLHNNIRLQRENILSLPFTDGTFDYILCWGVLMHIPDVEKALSELHRVLKTHGILVISEGNMHSLQSIILRILKLLLRGEKATVKKTVTGLESWVLTSTGMLLTRQTNVRWLKNRLKDSGFIIKKHVAGQFTELYTKISSPLLRHIIHRFNRFWFNYVRIPYIAFGNILIVQKEPS